MKPILPFGIGTISSLKLNALNSEANSDLPPILSKVERTQNPVRRLAQG